MPATNWPVALCGVTESLVTTLGPNDRYNVAALGLYAPGRLSHDSVTARTWGRTRTWRNFTEHQQGFVQFTRDPVVFVDGALDIREQDEPVLDSADAWVEVTVEKLRSRDRDGTQVVDWKLIPEHVEVEQTVVPTYNRAYGAVVEATVATSRLDVDAYDTEKLRRRIEYCGDVVDRCGGPREREAFERVTELAGLERS